MINTKSIAIFLAVASQALAFSTHHTPLQTVTRQTSLFANKESESISRREALQTSATAAAAFVASSLPVNAEGEGKLIEFTVANLDGEEGKTGTFTVKTHPEWAPIGAERFEVGVVQRYLQLNEIICFIMHYSHILSTSKIRHWHPNHSSMDAVYSAFCPDLYLNLASMETRRYKPNGALHPYVTIP